MNNLVLKRMTAFFIDYIVIAGYALLLFGVASIFRLNSFDFSPIGAQVLGFLTLTLPVFLFFFLMEQGRTRATLGKKAMNIYVDSGSQDVSSKIFMRNVLKFLPWEIAHTGVHWMAYYSDIDISIPFWVWGL